MKKIFLWRTNVRATTAIEYSLIVGGIAVAIAGIVFTIGSDLTPLYQSVSTMTAAFVPD